MKQIYKKFGIPPNLQEHMVRVYGIVCLIQDHWIGPDVDWDKAKKIALLHDMGNVVRFDLDKYPEFLGEEQKNIKHWKKVQKKIIERYGSDDHEATKKMLEEIELKNETISMIMNKSFGNSVEVEKSDIWPLKILYYADLRTLPLGIGTLQERIDDIKQRMSKYSNRPDLHKLINSCRSIEKQVAKNLDFDVSEINNESVSKKLKKSGSAVEEIEILVD